MGLNNLTINISVKIKWWLECLIKILGLLNRVNLVSTDKAKEIINKYINRGILYKLGKGDWKSFDIELT